MKADNDPSGASSLSQAEIVHRLRQAYARFEDELKGAATKCDFVRGKWLIFVPPEVIHETWAKIVRETAGEGGKLGALGCVTGAKMSTRAGSKEDEEDTK